MTRTLLVASFVCLVFAALGCGEATSTGPTMTTQQAIVGNWISQGADVAPLLAGAPFNWTKITATFNGDGSYLVVGIDTSQKQTTFTGTWTSTASTVSGIYDITVNQSTPATTTAQGIWQVDGSQLKYEVVQTQPTNGLTPPTAASGFGSTVYNGKQIATLIQTFVRQ